MKRDRQQQIFEAKCDVTSQERCLSPNVFTENEEDDMFKSLDIQEHMEVVGSDGKHVGTVDHKEGGDRLMLTKDDPKAGGHHHLISFRSIGSIMWTARFTSISRRKKPQWNGRQSPEFS
jgi:hypothetical protein